MKRRWVVALALATAIVAGISIGFSGGASVGYERDLQQLLGPRASAWVDHAQVAAWQPDPNLKPASYFAQRRTDEAGFRRLTQESGLAVKASAAIPEAIWQLPAGVSLGGWAADKVPSGAGLDARGSVGEAMVFARWYAGDLWVVVTRGAQ